MALVVKVLAAVPGLLPPLHAYVPPPVAVKLTWPQPVAVPVMPAVGVGLTVMVKVVGVPVQPLPPVTKLPIENGSPPTVTVLVTVLVAALITDTMALSLATYTSLPSGLTDIPVG